MPPFDPLRASFWLVAFVVGVHCLVVLMGTVLCMYKAFDHTVLACEDKGRLSDLLAGVLAAALAFGGGFGRKPPSE
jgi:hypothetical protein